MNTFWSLIPSIHHMMITISNICIRTKIDTWTRSGRRISPLQIAASRLSTYIAASNLIKKERMFFSCKCPFRPLKIVLAWLLYLKAKPWSWSFFFLWSTINLQNYCNCKSLLLPRCIPYVRMLPYFCGLNVFVFLILRAQLSSLQLYMLQSCMTTFM